MTVERESRRLSVGVELSGDGAHARVWAPACRSIDVVVDPYGGGARRTTVLGRDEDGIPSLAGKYVGHKNPMDAIQLTYKTGSELSQKFWNDMRISQFDTHSYVVTIFNETDSLAASLDFVRGVKQFVATLMHEMEQAATGT